MGWSDLGPEQKQIQPLEKQAGSQSPIFEVKTHLNHEVKTIRSLSLSALSFMILLPPLQTISSCFLSK